MYERNLERKCHKCANLIKDLKCGLGETKPYYCKGDYIWSDENGNITSKSRQEFEKSCDNCKHNIMFGMCEISGERVPYDEMPCEGDDWEIRK